MSDGAIDLKADARARAYSIPLDEINLTDPDSEGTPPPAKK